MKMKNIPDTLRARIEEKGMTIKATAEKAGLTQQALSAMLGYRQKITATAFVGLCAVLDLKPDDFIEQED